MTQWMCDECGYVHDDDNPPDVCPVCESPGSQFSEVVDDLDLLLGGDSDSDDDSDE